jgi:putative transposase
MAQTLSNLISHLIFSTKERRPLINEEFRHDLHAYLGGIVRNLRGAALTINGVSDHVHLLIQLPPSLSMSDAVRTIKANSTRWVHERTRNKLFAWQAGYGVFSVSRSNVDVVARYIANQEAHHRKRSFQDEYVDFLKRHDVDYDERYIWS